ncbi:MAG: penicillin-binding transpeptidase domain-containing protein, partial [bacterium]
LRVLINTTAYLFAEDVDTDFITMVKEARLPAVSVEKSYRRAYHTTYASQLLGTMGYITREYYDAHKGEGYTLNSIVGRSGVESAFEPWLRGTDGTVTTSRGLNGDLLDVSVTREAEAGANLYLTIDLRLQKVAEDSLAATIAAMNAAREAEAQAKAGLENTYEPPELAEGGAVVVLDVHSAEVLAMASYPSFDLATYRRDITALNADPLRPLWNRCTQGPYEPGSTFKMVTALAGLNSGTIDPGTTIFDEGEYTEYADSNFTPHCWIYPGSHGSLDVVGALENSCNYFFYWVSDHMGINAIVKTAGEFGLGSPTGVEIGEVSGILASREYKREALNDGWYAADTLQAAIGQSYNLFTPIQIANYVATIANGGTHYQCSLLNRLVSGDYSAVLREHAPTVLNVIDDTNGYFSLLQRGMRRVVTSGTAASSFRGFPIAVAAKTGTVQSDSAGMNTGVFVLYAPAENPEIAIAVVVEKGGSGSALTQIAKDIVLAFYEDTTQRTTVPIEGVLAR